MIIIIIFEGCSTLNYPLCMCWVYPVRIMMTHFGEPRTRDLGRLSSKSRISGSISRRHIQNLACRLLYIVYTSYIRQWWGVYAWEGLLPCWSIVKPLYLRQYPIALHEFWYTNRPLYLVHINSMAGGRLISAESGAKGISSTTH